MNLVENYAYIRESIASIKYLKKKYITNFYENQKVVSSWIDNKIFYTDSFEEVVFLFKKKRGFYNLYYIAATTEAIENGLKLVLKENPKVFFVSDIITKTEKADVKAKFENSGFYEYTSLMRMNRINQYNPDDYKPNNNTRLAALNEAGQIFKLLHKYFDPISEQLPTKEKLLEWIDNENVLVYMNGKKVAGFIIYKLIGYSLYLKYWFVHPDYRDHGIGSKLFELFLYNGSDSKQQIFWVIRSNENAIKRYKHYGFKKDNLFDFVMTNKI